MIPAKAIVECSCERYRRVESIGECSTRSSIFLLIPQVVCRLFLIIACILVFTGSPRWGFN